MKGEYRDDKDTMFSKYRHHHHQTPPPFAITNHHHFNLSNNTSEEADSLNNNNNRERSRSPPSQLTNKKPSLNDGETIEVSRRPRGRPPGSKNKPKPPIIITREPDPALTMSPYVFELPAGVDIVESVNKYCKTRNMGLCVMTGSGTVTNVSLRQPTSTPPASVTFHGRFDILSLSATVIPAVSPSAPFANGFTISLAGPQGQIVGGAVSGQLISGGTVFIIAASFNNPLYHRLGGGDDEHDHDVIEGRAIVSVGNVGHSGGGGGGGSHEQSPAAGSGGGGGGGSDHVPQSNESMSMYSVHLPSDVIWAPSARQASSHQQPY